MSLADYQPERTKVNDHRGRSLATVRGLNLNDLSILVRTHGPALRHIYDDSQTGDSVLIDLAKAATVAVVQEPGVTATAIALGSDEPDAADKVATLSAPLQIKLLMEILRLTFEDVGGPLEFVALVGEAIRQSTVRPDPATIQ